ncbi:60S ribosomal protein L38 [Schizopora paradoxa]|uniref:60S ribosomal protein L38 n=1 Tax=Schizopora paradoxa TaxID=27342 RepID=A0A0H2S1R7_9AGAM|nr:60S ribosomal protein L38 [Schizopora paradoxa]
MPKQIFDTKEFLQICNRADTSKKLTIKTVRTAKGEQVKHKLRAGRLLYTMVHSDRERAQKVQETLNQDKLKVTEISRKGK